MSRQERVVCNICGKEIAEFGEEYNGCMSCVEVPITDDRRALLRVSRRSSSTLDTFDLCEHCICAELREAWFALGKALVAREKEAGIAVPAAH